MATLAPEIMQKWAEKGHTSVEIEALRENTLIVTVWIQVNDALFSSEKCTGKSSYGLISATVIADLV